MVRDPREGHGVRETAHAVDLIDRSVASWRNSSNPIERRSLLVLLRISDVVKEHDRLAGFSGARARAIATDNDELAALKDKWEKINQEIESVFRKYFVVSGTIQLLDEVLEIFCQGDTKAGSGASTAASSGASASDGPIDITTDGLKEILSKLPKGTRFKFCARRYPIKPQPPKKDPCHFFHPSGTPGSIARAIEDLKEWRRTVWISYPGSEVWQEYRLKANQ